MGFGNLTVERRHSASSPCVSVNISDAQLINNWDHMKAAITVLVSVSVWCHADAQHPNTCSPQQECCLCGGTVRARPLTNPFYLQLHVEYIKYSLLPSELQFCQRVLPPCSWPGGRDGCWHSWGVVWLPGGAPEQCKGSFPALPSQPGIILPALPLVTTRG